MAVTARTPAPTASRGTVTQSNYSGRRCLPAHLICIDRKTEEPHAIPEARRNCHRDRRPDRPDDGPGACPATNPADQADHRAAQRSAGSYHCQGLADRESQARRFHRAGENADRQAGDRKAHHRDGDPDQGLGRADPLAPGDAVQRPADAGREEAIQRRHCRRLCRSRRRTEIQRRLPRVHRRIRRHRRAICRCRQRISEAERFPDRDHLRQQGDRCGQGNWRQGARALLSPADARA